MELQAILSVIIVSLISLLAALPLLIKKEISKKTLLLLLSGSVGVLLATVFMDLLPEAVHEGYTMEIALYILAGFLIMFVLEKLVHMHHKGKDKHVGHGHAYNLVAVNLVGDAIHNFIDGVIIAASYSVSTAVGIATTISVIFHELPQELADFSVLLYSGVNKKKALMFNLFAASSAILGTILGIFFIKNIEGFIDFMIPFAAGNFLYIAASNLLPQLHRECKVKDDIMHFAAIILGIGVIYLVSVFFGHMH